MVSNKIIFTGGHHNSSLVVANLCKENGYQVYWFGHRHSMWGDSADSAEYKEVVAAGIPFFDLKAGKLYGTFSPLKLIRLPIGFIQAFIWLLKIKPNCIVSFGGYLAVPTVIMGKLLSIPSLTHEQTVTAGWANRLVGKFANKIAVSWPSSVSHYPKSKVVFTGLPIRSELIQTKKAPASKRPILYVTGGKQGSHIINEHTFSLLAELEKTYRIIHQTGTSTRHNDLEKAEKLKNKNYEPFGYSGTYAVDSLIKADVVVCRAGAHTVYELGVLGKRSVLIPLPFSSHNEQYKNARVLKDAGIGIILEQKDLSVESLKNAINAAHNLKEKSLDLPLDADKKILQLIKQLCVREEN